MNEGQAAATAAKTNRTAAVLIPPEDVWGPIQEIREAHDIQARRWMPHVTLLYPFRPRSEFEALEREMTRACSAIRPFPVGFSRFQYFDYRDGHYAVWLAPEPAHMLVTLQQRLWRVAPDCDEVHRLRGGFTPHLAVGQVQGRKNLEALLARLQPEWPGVAFTASKVSLIWRNDAPDDVFRVGGVVPLGVDARDG